MHKLITIQGSPILLWTTEPFYPCVGVTFLTVPPAVYSTCYSKRGPCTSTSTSTGPLGGRISDPT